MLLSIVKVCEKILQKEDPQDYVLATGRTSTVREFVELSFKELGINVNWKGVGKDEVGINSETGKIIVRVDPKYFRPTEVDILVGDPSKAKRELNWAPKTNLEELIKIMIKSDWEKLNKNGA